jgi:hypothetical protein
VKGFWTLTGSLLAIPTLAFGTTQVLTAIAHEQERLERSFPAAAVDVIDIRGEGTVEVVGADVDEITVHMRVSHGLRRTNHREVVEGRTLVLDVSCPAFLSDFCQVDHTVEVPRDLDVVVDNDDGRIVLTGLAGELDVDGDNGRLVGTDLRSSVARVSNDNGRIELAFREPPDRLEVDNDNGRIELVLPAVDEGYAVQAQTENGSVDNAVRSDPTSPRVVAVENDNGSITLRNP